MAGDLETGVMVMRMEEGLDTGPVALTERFAIGPDANAGEISGRLALAGANLMARALLMLEDGALVFMPQATEGITYAHKIDKAEARIDWTKPAADLHNLVRGLAPAPVRSSKRSLARALSASKFYARRSQKTQGHPAAFSTCI
jgi:methionyl-tRNA formyltransferase